MLIIHYVYFIDIAIYMKWKVIYLKKNRNQKLKSNSILQFEMMYNNEA